MDAKDECSETGRQQAPACGERRSFLKRLTACLAGGAASLVPAGAALSVWMSPPRRQPAGPGSWVRVTTLPSLPEGQSAKRFPVVADRFNVWNRIPAAPLGLVFLRRTGPDGVEAFNAVCPHAGCLVDLDPERGGFKCPCHESWFAANGDVDDPASPSPRSLDRLETELRGDEVWVRFQNFRAGIRERVPVS
jgi:Rieske Fe-S protein